jgi:hypothetical protein
MRRLLRSPLQSVVLRRGVALGGGGALAVAAYLSGAEDEYRAVPEERLPATYDPEAIARVWGDEHPRCALARLSTIARRTVPFAARLLGDQLRLAIFEEAADARDERHERRARQLRLMLTDLGPTCAARPARRARRGRAARVHRASRCRPWPSPPPPGGGARAASPPAAPTL